MYCCNITFLNWLKFEGHASLSNEHAGLASTMKSKIACSVLYSTRLSYQFILGDHYFMNILETPTQHTYVCISSRAIWERKRRRDKRLYIRSNRILAKCWQMTLHCAIVFIKMRSFAGMCLDFNFYCYKHICRM